MGAWIELTLTGLARADLERISTILFAQGSTGLQEDWLPGQAPLPQQPWDPPSAAPVPDPLVLRAWFDTPDRDGVEAALGPMAARLAWSEVADQDWEAASQARFPPIVVTGRNGIRLTVAPPWDAPEGALILEPGQGFGTGDHPTTRQALQAVCTLAPDLTGTALDVGCGSGILALAAARFGLTPHGIDVEAGAVAQAIDQAQRNGLDQATFSTDPLHTVSGTFDLVLANLHAELLIRLAPDLIARTGRHLVLAGILSDRCDRVRACFDVELILDHVEDDGAWSCLWYRTPEAP